MNKKALIIKSKKLNAMMLNPIQLFREKKNYQQTKLALGSKIIDLNQIHVKKLNEKDNLLKEINEEVILIRRYKKN